MEIHKERGGIGCYLVDSKQLLFSFVDLDLLLEELSRQSIQGPVIDCVELRGVHTESELSS